MLGAGLGGFFDGILLHQILQWHHMLTSEGDHPATTVEGLETNTLWDGVFHLAAWLVTIAGVALVLRSWRRDGALPARRLLGLALVGWGLFNVVDQLAFHLTDVHHIREGENQQAYDWALFALGALLIALGAGLARARATSRAGPRARNRR